ncbi:MAG: C40 family peptidase [Gaiellales bacterium]
MRAGVGSLAAVLAAVSLGSHVTPAQAAKGQPLLRRGDTGSVVVRVQRLLHVPVDGIFGPGTAGAVRRFQHRHHLLVDGQVGPQTWRALRAAQLHARHPRQHSVLGLGDRGPAVTRLQRALHIRANALYDHRTWLAVRRFQHRHHLLVDGQVGPQTRAVLRHWNHPGAIAGTLGERAVAVARRYAGVPYRWGGATPRGFDCSGLVQYVYGRLGVELPRVTYDQFRAGRHVRRNQLQAGDLVFFHRVGHVGIWIGHGWFIQALRTGTLVHTSQLSGWYVRHWSGAVRVG